MKKVTLLLAFLALMGWQASYAQTVSGTVTDAKDGSTLPGVTVAAKGLSGVGTITDFDGKYSFDVKGATTLVFTFVGMDTKEVVINGRTSVNVAMGQKDHLVDEVIVTAYGTTRKAGVTGAVSVVKAKKLEQVPTTSLDKALQGNVAGLQSMSNSGQPGSSSEVRIRGIGSISAGNQPLYIIDGVPIITGDLAQGNANGLSDVLSNLNPNDIASISVLKDAAETSLYGARASNGVILITTKQGKSGKTQFKVRAQYGYSSRTTNNFEVLNSSQFIELRREGLINAGRTPEVATVLAGKDSINTDWVNVAFVDNAPTQSYEVSASGGTEKTKFFISGQYFDQEGIAMGSYLERASTRINIDHQANDKLSFGTKIGLSYAKQGTPLTSSAYFISPVVGAYLMRPTAPAYNADGTAHFDSAGPTGGASFVGVDMYNVSKSNTARLVSSANVEYAILENLKFKSLWGLDFIDLTENEWDDPRNPGNTSEGKGRASVFKTRNVIWNTTNTLAWNKQINDIHNLNALVGFEMMDAALSYMGASTEKFPTTVLHNLDSGAEPTYASSSGTGYSLMSSFGKLQYNYNNRYYFNASLRRDGSSRFGANNRWASFWAMGASWRISEESFMNVSFIDNLKLRASYGTSGNSEITNFASLGLYGYGSVYNNNPGSAPSQIANPDLVWESNSNFNLGLDFGLFNNRISGILEYYQMKTTDLLLRVPLSSTSGFTSALQNIGGMSNSGVEFTLNATILNAPVKWDINWNITSNKNIVDKLYKGEDIPDGTKIIREGYALQTFYMAKWAGVNPGNGDALWYDSDGNVTNVYANADKQIVGNADPDFYGGFTNTFSYKGFELSVFFSYSKGNLIYNNTSRITQSDGAFAAFNQSVLQLDRWQKPGDISENPKRVDGNSSNSNQMSTRWLEDGSYLRLKNLTFAYRLPSDLVKRAKFSSVRIYAQGQNLWTSTEFKGLDPEQNLSGTHWFTYPNARTFTFGIDIGF